MNSSPWVRSFTWDMIWINNMIPAGIIIFLMFSISIPLSMIFLTLFFWGPHLGSPFYLTVKNKKYRNHMKSDAKKYLLLPLILCLSCVTLGSPGGLGFANIVESTVSQNNIQIFNSLMFIAMIYAIFAMYHSAAQCFGVLSIYRLKGSIRSNLQRNFDKYFCYLSALLILIGWYIVGSKALIGIMEFNHFGPALSDSESLMLSKVVIGLSVIVTGLMVFREMTNPSITMWQRILFLTTSGLAPVVVFWSGPLSLGMIYLNHWTVAIGLAIHTSQNFSDEQVDKSFLTKSPIYLYLQILVFSLPLSLVILGTLYTEPRSSGFTDLQNVGFWASTLFGIRIGTSFAHYIYDRYCYKFSNPIVKETIGTALFKSPSLNSVNSAKSSQQLGNRAS